jgi:aminoglycoside phosphotransferase (APT) family kinase protein
MTVIVTGEAVAIRRREAEETSLTGLAATLPAGLATLVPQWLGRFDVEGAQAFVQSTRPGVTCDVDVPFLSTVTRAAAACLADLHRHTRDRSQPLRPATLMSSLCIAASERIPGLSGSLSGLREAIEESAAKLDFPLVWMHGDFKIENVMYDPGSGALTGVIDWELSMPAGLPLLDLLYLCTFNRMIRGQSRLDAFRALSLGEGLEEEEREMISDYLNRLGIHDAQRLPLGIAFVCHDIGCRIQWDVVPADALREASQFLDELCACLLAWQGTPPS